jgi:phage terminase small subunit
MEKLSKQEKVFVNELAITGNKTQSVKKAYGIEDDNYAGVKGNRLIRNDKINTAIQEVKRTIAEQIPDDLLVKVQLEGLGATITTTKDGEEFTKPDHAIRHKYLDTGLKIKGTYAPEKSVVLDINVDITNEKAMDIAKEFEAKLKLNL